MKTSVKKWICVLSNLIASIWTRSICQIQATFRGVKILRILFRLKKMKENSSSYVYVNRQIRRFHVVVVQWTSKKCTKRRDAPAELLFWLLNLLFFWSRRCCRRCSCLSSLLICQKRSLDFPEYFDNEYSSHLTQVKEHGFLQHMFYIVHNEHCVFRVRDATRKQPRRRR